MNRRAFALLCCALITGCRKAAPPRQHEQQINDSNMYISSNPITNRPVTFRVELTQEQARLVREALALRHGPAGTTITPAGEGSTKLSDLEVESRIVRKVSVKQGETVLFEQEEALTESNLEALCSWNTSDGQWDTAFVINKPIDFSVNYWRYWKASDCSGGDAIVAISTRIPVNW